LGNILNKGGGDLLTSCSCEAFSLFLLCLKVGENKLKDGKDSNVVSEREGHGTAGYVGGTRRTIILKGVRK